MLKSLYVENGVRHHKVTFHFDKGMTAITGPNESGKSLIVEFIRFSLFGSKALRDKIEKLKTVLSFTVRGVDYVVTRSGTKAELLRGDEPVATGTLPVNRKIVEILGYNMTVFDTANSINQGEIESLGKMTPAERKRMVDQTIGLDVLDNVAKKLGDMSSVEAKTAQSIGEGLTVPVAPTAPDGYRPSSDLAVDKAQLEQKLARKNQLKGWLSSSARWASKPEEPVKPCDETSEELEAHQELRLHQVASRTQLERQLSRLRSTNVTLEQLAEEEALLEQHELWQKAQAWPKPPSYTVEALKEDLLQWDRCDRIREAEAIQKKIDALRSKGSHTCPACDHTWDVEQDSIASLEEEMKPYQDVAGMRAVEPSISKARIALEMERIEQYQPNPYGDAEAPSRVPMTRAKIEETKTILSEMMLRDSLLNEINSIKVVEDKSQKLAQRRSYEAKLATYHDDLNKHEQYLIEEAAIRSELRDLQDVETELASISQLMVLSARFEQESMYYNQRLVDYESALKRKSVHQQRADQYKSARTAIQLLKGRIKSYLVPSLSKVASKLIKQMTDGKRNQIDVSDDFEISVDGESLNKLSGSGKAVANLAIRIALGQVLTNKVFSVLMADEIDAAMDKSRAESTANCLKSLTDSINQIVLISHKRPEADHYIELG